ncbi:uncharacterized protein A4U43_C07F5800 [Asparagus officinalis]|uniref:Rad21/Rec8-like protein C-terminal eukaryotic domain-containing protein n=1 Tax=Asparagus officinalis TaxID=4686 RepID=A0A5P1ED15_ASPOF|nr:uncharacterized protein A4U43_C07F5800 [Asparagus officinalis]
MFYSHQLLARKAPLGQVWMAATMHAKINRRKLDKLDLVKIWFEAVTLPEAVDMEMEQPMNFFSDTSTTAARFQRMRLDDLDEHFININPGDEEQSLHHHQADAANITLFDDFGSGMAETDLYNRFERFDIGEDEEIQMNFTPQEQPTLVPSPPREYAQQQPRASCASSPPTHHESAPQHEPMVEEQEERLPEQHDNAAQEAVEPEPEAENKQKSSRRKARRNLPRVIMDDEQIMIPGNIYQSWLQDASSIISKRRRKTKLQHPISTTKLTVLMELPPLALMTGLDNFPSELHYPGPLLNLWRKCTDSVRDHGSSSAGTSPEARRNPVSHSPPESLSRRNNINYEFPPGEYQSEIGSQHVSPIEKGRAEQVNMEFHAIFNDADLGGSDRFTTPSSPGRLSSGSIPSSGSGHIFLPHEQEVLPSSSRYKKRQHSSARSDLGNLDPVEEETPMVQDVRGFKIRRLSETRPTYDTDLLEETADPTQTPHPVITEPTVDRVTQSIRTHLKMHFDTPGNPQSESIDQLAAGMNRKKAAQLFYQTCVLATLDFVKVHQAEAYGEILISKGSKM